MKDLLKTTYQNIIKDMKAELDHQKRVSEWLAKKITKCSIYIDEHYEELNDDPFYWIDRADEQVKEKDNDSK